MSAALPEVALQALEEAITFEREIPTGLRELKAPIVAINPNTGPRMSRHSRGMGSRSSSRQEWATS